MYCQQIFIFVLLVDLKIYQNLEKKSLSVLKFSNGRGLDDCFYAIL